MSTIKPILFNTEMTLAALENRKSQTRRLVTPTPPTDAQLVMTPDKRNGWDESKELPGLGPDDRRVYYPRYYPGDILYVRETWAEWSGGYIFKADPMPSYPHSFVDRWHPSIHMPREAARIFLRVTDVRVERLQEITDEGAKAEGANNGIGVSDKIRETAIERFQRIWNSTLKHMDHIRYGWAANPWVWVYCFERCEKPEDWA